MNVQHPTLNFQQNKKTKNKNYKAKINVDLFFLFRCFNTCYKNLDEFLSFL